MVDHDELDRLRNTALVMHDSKVQAAETFYGELFKVAPDLRDLFPAQISGQARKFAATLAVSVNALADWESLRPIIEALARRHLAYGVKAEHYAIVEQALVSTLKTHGATAEEIDTWEKVYRILADHMKAIAYPDHGPAQVT